MNLQVGNVGSHVILKSAETMQPQISAVMNIATAQQLVGSLNEAILRAEAARLEMCERRDEVLTERITKSAPEPLRMSQLVAR